MQITCQSCGQPVQAEDVNIQAAIAKCGGCGSVFELVGGAAAPPKTEVERPKGFEVEQHPDRLVLARRWPRIAALPLLGFAAIWNGFLVFWYSAAIGDSSGEPLDILMVLFPLGHVAAGLVVTYIGLAFLLNKTRLEAMVDRLTVRIGPLPWPGKRDLNPADVSQVFCKEKIHHGNNGGSHTTYQMHAQLVGGKTIKLVSGLHKPEHARFMEQELEKALGIKDRAVAGEVRG